MKLTKTLKARISKKMRQEVKRRAKAAELAEADIVRLALRQYLEGAA